jgi:hypothetical protein
VPGIEEVLSTTPTMLGIQPFGHVTSTPKFIMAMSQHGAAGIACWHGGVNIIFLRQHNCSVCACQDAKT